MCTDVICKYYSIPQKEREHLWILLSEAFLELVPNRYKRTILEEHWIPKYQDSVFEVTLLDWELLLSLCSEFENISELGYCFVSFFSPQFFIFLDWCHYVICTGFQLVIVLPLLLQCWDNRRVLAPLFFSLKGNKMELILCTKMELVLCTGPGGREERKRTKSSKVEGKRRGSMKG